VHQLGLLGGSFDPPHRMHVRLAAQALSQLDLDALWILPTAWPGHRQAPIASFEQRMAMCRLAFDGLAQAEVSDLEAQRPAPTYTVDTLTAASRLQPQAQIWLIIGADQAAAFHTWHRWTDVLTQCRLAVAMRPGSASPSPQLVQWHNDHHMALSTLELAPDPLSATQLRAQLRQTPMANPTGLDPRVWQYIQDHHLYRN
jgi:nicotinate-nucleotide adenylyltransferase